MPPSVVGVALRARPLCPCCGSPAYKRVGRCGRLDKPFTEDGKPTEYVVIARCLRCGVSQYRRDGIVGQLDGLRMLVSNVREHAPYSPDPMRVATLEVWGKLVRGAIVRLVKPGELESVDARVVEYKPSWDRWGSGRTEPLLAVNLL